MPNLTITQQSGNWEAIISNGGPTYQFFGTTALQQQTSIEDFSLALTDDNILLLQYFQNTAGLTEENLFEQLFVDTDSLYWDTTALIIGIEDGELASQLTDVASELALKILELF